MTDLVVADASPLIVLARIGHLKTLSRVAERVIVPDVVVQECAGDLRRPGAQAIVNAFAEAWLTRQPAGLEFEPVSAVGLGPGESSAIGLALAINAPLLMDERLGRQVAIARKLVVVGTVGVLLRAKQRGLIPSVGATLAALKNEGFYISSALEHEVLLRAGETHSTPGRPPPE